MPLPLTLQQLSPLFCFHDPGMTFVLSMQGLQERGYNRFNAIFLEGQQSDAFCAWQLSQCGWMENGRRASGANAPIVATNLLWWRETAPPWSQKDRIHRVHHFTFASDAVSVFTCVHFPAGSEFCSCSFHLMSLDSKSLHFTSFAFRLALTFCDLALLLRPSLLYQRSVKRSWLWPQGEL